MMEFRPCIDIHNGKVKQIVGGTLADRSDSACENFVAGADAAYFANLYKSDGLYGGHVILLNAKDSPYYEQTKKQALLALRTYPGGLMVGGGIDSRNASAFLRAGASHVIVTSYVFREGRIDYDRLEELTKAVGKEHLVLDLSCRKKDDGYYVVTDRWQRFTDQPVTAALFDALSDYCDEYLIHAVDVEGKVSGIEAPLVELLGSWGKLPVTYAGGISGFSDLEQIRSLGQGHVHATIGSALDLFGGSMSYRRVLEYFKNEGGLHGQI